MLRFISVLSFTLLVLAAAFGRQQKLTRQPSMKPPSLNRKSDQTLRDVTAKEMLFAAAQAANLCSCPEIQNSLTAVKLSNEILTDIVKDLQAKLASTFRWPPSKNAMCPPGFTYLPSAEKCYMAVYESLDWSSAGKKCQKLRSGANLAAIESRKEDDAVKSFLASELSKNVDNRACLPKDAPIFFWTSGQRINETCQSSFVWKPTSGKRLALTFEAWRGGDPNCANGDESCLSLWGDYGFKWIDWRCNEKTCSLCEYKP